MWLPCWCDLSTRSFNVFGGTRDVTYHVLPPIPRMLGGVEGGGSGIHPQICWTNSPMGGATSLPFPLAVPLINTGAGAEVLATGLSEAGAILFLALAGLCFVGSRDLLTSAGFEDSLSLKMMRGAALRDLLSCTWGCARQFLLMLQHILSLTQGTQAVMPLPDPLLPACSKHSFPPLKHLQHGGSWSWQVGTGCLSCQTTGRFTSTLLSSTSSSSLSSSASTSITTSTTILPFPLFS